MDGFTGRTSEMYKPAYALFATNDPDDNTLVLAIRGTANMREVLTDLVCQPLAIAASGLFPGKSSGGSTSEQELAAVHEGLWRAALGLVAELGGPMERVLSERPRHRLLVTGHSLGAGTAALLCLLWRPWLGDRVSCIGFATPQVLDESSARTAAAHGVTSVLLFDDVVPRLSQRSAEDFAAEVAKVAHEHHHWREKGFKPTANSVSGGGGTAETPQHELSGDYRPGQPAAYRPGQPAAAANVVKQAANTPALFPAGRLLLLESSNPSGRKCCKEVDQQVFSRIRVTRSMLMSHLQPAYLRGLGADK